MIGRGSGTCTPKKARNRSSLTEFFLGLNFIKSIAGLRSDSMPNSSASSRASSVSSRRMIRFRNSFFLSNSSFWCNSRTILTKSRCLLISASMARRRSNCDDSKKSLMRSPKRRRISSKGTIHGPISDSTYIPPRQLMDTKN